MSVDQLLPSSGKQRGIPTDKMGVGLNPIQHLVTRCKRRNLFSWIDDRVPFRRRTGASGVKGWMDGVGALYRLRRWRIGERLCRLAEKRLRGQKGRQESGANELNRSDAERPVKY